ncbi:MAG: restriction endonuclease [Bacteroidota bacterium]
MSNQLIQVFEYEILRYPSERGGVAFTEHDFRALVKFNEQHQNRYFTIVHQGIRFLHYVGVLQVGSLTLEILPKADQDKPTEASKERWQGILLDMLRECRLLKAETGPIAPLQTRPGTLLEAYFQAFITEIESLLRKGLVKKYRPNEGNQDTLKGSLHFGQHLRQNLVHQERFYVRYQTYDTQHPIHQLLYQALHLLPQLISNQSLIEQATHLLACFPPMPAIRVSEQAFSKIKLDRKTQPYQVALSLARLLLLGYQPDVRGGSEHVLSILFDMNTLFEEYIYRQLKQEETESVRIQRQEPVYFWENKRVRPDIIIRQVNAANETTTFIVDTKWKVLRRLQPDDDDLKQMYVYNQYYQAVKSVLLYPDVYQLGDRHGHFHLTNPFLSDDPTKQAHGCEIRFVQLVEKGRLRKNVGRALLDAIMDIPI